MISKAFGDTTSERIGLVLLVVLGIAVALALLAGLIVLVLWFLENAAIIIPLVAGVGAAVCIVAYIATGGAALVAVAVVLGIVAAFT